MRRWVCYVPVIYSFIRNTESITSVFHKILAFREVFLLFPALYYAMQPDLFNFAARFAIAFTVGRGLYEMGYLVNDLIVAKYEDKPSIRSYEGKVNLPVALGIRALMLAAAMLLFRSPATAVAVAIVSALIAIHNSTKRKKDRLASNPALRLSRYMFIVIVTADLEVPVITACMIVLLPIFAVDVAMSTLGIASRYLQLNTSDFAMPYYFWILTFLPIQLILLWDYSPLILLGEFGLLILSVVRHWRRRL